MSVRRRSIRDRATSHAVRIAFAIVARALPFSACGPIGRVLGGIAWRLGIRRSIAERNLELAFPDLPAADRERIARRSAANLLTVFLEMTVLRRVRRGRLVRLIEFENLDLLRSVDGRPAVLLSGHFGNWELLALAAGAASGRSIAVVVNEHDDDDELEAMRIRFGNRLIPTSRGARESVRELARGGAVAMLADQSAPEEETSIDLLGIPTHWFTAPARLALRFDARVVVGYAVRQPGGRYLARLAEIPHDDLVNDSGGVRMLTQRYVATLEAAILRNPEQWVWHHRRWKHTAGVRYD